MVDCAIIINKTRRVWFRLFKSDLTITKMILPTIVKWMKVLKKCWLKKLKSFNFVLIEKKSFWKSCYWIGLMKYFRKNKMILKFNLLLLDLIGKSGPVWMNESGAHVLTFQLFVLLGSTSTLKLWNFDLGFTLNETCSISRKPFFWNYFIFSWFFFNITQIAVFLTLIWN
jgi:hypothetical protein